MTSNLGRTKISQEKKATSVLQLERNTRVAAQRGNNCRVLETERSPQQLQREEE